MELEDYNPNLTRAKFDPSRTPQDRFEDAKGHFNLDTLHRISGGNAAILVHMGYKMAKVAPESDINVIREESVSTENVPKTVLEVATGILDRFPSIVFESFTPKLLQDLTMSEQEINELESLTKGHKELWKSHRNYRITASVVKSVIAKVQENDFKSDKIDHTLNILSGNAPEVQTVATKYGQTNKNLACSLAYKKLSNEHVNLRINEVGLIIKKDMPYLAATPDRILKCDCCGVQTLEVKNPYSGRSMSIQEYCCMKTGCLIKIDGIITLKKKHPYYYQVQC